MATIKLALVAAIVFVMSSILARAEGDAQNGQSLAREWCARCHNVEPNGPFKLHPPSFASIAVYRSEDQVRSRIAFPPVHTIMPQIAYILTPENIDDLVTYIVSLEGN
ncbi:MAG: cytochrome c [Rhizobiaceae bacterium]